MAAVRDLTIDQGVDYSKTFRVLINSVAVDLTDCTFLLVARARLDKNSEELLRLTTENGGIVIESPSTDGRFTIVLTDAQTNVDWEKAYYDLIYFDSDGVGKKWLKGTICVAPTMSAS